jgi:hypothetical protein
MSELLSRRAVDTIAESTDYIGIERVTGNLELQLKVTPTQLFARTAQKRIISGYSKVGGTVTVDADLRKMTAAAADVSDASVGAITQLSVTADTIMSASNTAKGALTEVVAADETFYVLLTATTGASTDIALQGVAITVTES